MQPAKPRASSSHSKMEAGSSEVKVKARQKMRGGSTILAALASGDASDEPAGEDA